MARVGAWAVALGAAGCAADAQPPVCADQDGVGMRAIASTAADRKLLGEAAAYLPDGTLRARAEELATSQRERRAAAWRVVERVVAPVSLAVATPAEGAGADATVPVWRTWYDRDDLTRLFHRLYTGLGQEGRVARAELTAEALDEAFGWNPTAVEELDNWPADRWQAYVEALDEAVEIDGVGGIRRIAMSPSAARHLLQSYDDVLACRKDGVPPAFVDGPAEAERRVVREPVTLATCATRAAGGYAVAAGESIHAVVEEGAGARIEIVAGATAGGGELRCAADADHGCTAAGPGIFFVVVRAGGAPVAGTLEVDYTAPDPPPAGCLDGRFPLDAATVIADWRRADVGWPLPTYDTSAAGLAARMSGGVDARTWGPGDGEADPGAGDIYTVRLPNGNTFRLAALHIGTRDLDDGYWITLWWAPNADQDFGADRPASLAALGPWANYKMCVASAFDERDQDPGAGYDADAPSLAAALRAVNGGDGAPSWCSNPYLDGAPGLAPTNCIGCHQHAGSGILSSDTALDEELFPLHGRVQVRNNFPHDFFWALDGAENMSGVFADEAAWWGDL